MTEDSVNFERVKAIYSGTIFDMRRVPRAVWRRLRVPCASFFTRAAAPSGVALRAPHARSLSAAAATAERTYCGALTLDDVGRTVTLKGHVHSLRAVGGVMFMVVRDWRGQVQAKWNAEVSGPAAAFELAERASLESVVELSGTVRARPESMVNPRMRTGALEVEVDSFAVLNAASDVPTKRAAPAAATSSERGGGDDGASNSHCGMPHAEEFLLRHRHMQLRDPSMQRNLKLRSDVTAAVRHCLRQLDFVEVETPLLFKSTPEGAREFLVPTRRHGAFYALPQSPQQYKQLLMASGVERYFQIARCFRDEGGRKDRQPEFTQIDVEMSYPTANDVMAVTEQIAGSAWGAAATLAAETAGSDAPLPLPIVEGGGPPFRRMKFDAALKRFGSDKPDLRLEPHMRISRVTALLAAQRDIHAERTATATTTTGAVAPPAIELQALRAPVIGGGLSNKETAALLSELGDVMEAEAKRSVAIGAPAPQLHSARLGSGGVSEWRWASFHSEQVPNVHRMKLSAEECGVLGSELACEEGDLVLVCSGEHDSACRVLGAARKLLGDRLAAMPESGISLSSSDFRFLWVESFPLFESTTAGDFEVRARQPALQSSHHPFTSPHPEDSAMMIDALDAAAAHGPLLLRPDTTVAPEHEAALEQLLSVRGQHYDLVVNGVEIGGGSIRIHDAAMQRRVMGEALAQSPEIVGGFDHLLSALGCVR